MAVSDGAGLEAEWARRVRHRASETAAVCEEAGTRHWRKIQGLDIPPAIIKSRITKLSLLQIWKEMYYKRLVPQMCHMLQMICYSLIELDFF